MRSTSMLSAGLVAGWLLLACSPTSGDPSNNSNNINNINNTTINNGICPTAQDDKLSQIHWLSRRIYHGTTGPGICLSDAQALAVGSLVTEDGGGSWYNFCSGTLVTDRYVLTASHCTLSPWGGEMDPSEVRFTLGDDALSPEDVFTVIAIHNNPDYDMWGNTTGWDHAILELDRSPLDYLPVEPIPYAATAPDNIIGNYVQQVGFGTTEDDNDNSTKWWTLELVDSVNETLGEMTVNGQGESSVCDGDSGGPSLHALGGSGLAIIGTVSWGDASCVDYDHYAMTHWDQTYLSKWIPEYDYCGDLPAEGTCDGTGMAVWCEGGIVHRECCDEITGPCTVIGGIAQCQNTRDVCPEGLDFRGTCDGTSIARWCFDGRVHTRDCVSCGQVCADTGNDTIGSYCVDPNL